MTRVTMSFIKSHRKPERRDQGSYGQIWEQTENPPKIYIQVSRDVMHPRWIRLGGFYEIALKDFLYDEQFMRTCLMMFHNK